MGKYLKQLTQKDIEDFLKVNNYELCNNLKNIDGENLPSLERDNDMIFMRCQRILSDDEKEINTRVAYELIKKYPAFMSLTMLARINKYSTDTDIVILTDFYANIISADRDREKRVNQLDENYIHFMVGKFKSQGYVQDYIEDAKRYETQVPSHDDEMTK